MQITQPILPSKIYAPAGIASAKQSVSDDLGVVGLGALPFGGLAAALSSIGGSGTPGAAVLYNMGSPAALTGLAAPQDHVVQGFARCGPHMRQLAIATGKPGVASTIWKSNEANTAFSVLAAPEAMVKSGLPLEVQNLAEYRPFAGADAGGSVMFSALVNDPDGDYALPGYVTVSTGAVTVPASTDLQNNDGCTQGSWVHSARYAYLGDALASGSPIGVPAIATLESHLQVQRSPDATFSGPYNQVMSVPAGSKAETATWTIEAFSGYLGGTNCLLLMGTGGSGSSYLYRSTDRGLTWTLALTQKGSCSYGLGHIHWLSNLEVIMATGQILYHSRDGGGTWRKIANVGDAVTALTGMADGSIYAGTQNGVIHRYAPLYW